MRNLNVFLAMLVLLIGCTSQKVNNRLQESEKSGSTPSSSRLVTEPKEGDVINASNLNELEIKGKCVDSAKTVQIRIESLPTITATCDSNSNWSAIVNLSSIQDGAIDISIRGFDNTNKETFKGNLSVTKDTTAPSLSLSEAIDPVVKRGETIVLSINASDESKSSVSLSYQVAWDGETYIAAKAFSGNSVAIEVPTSVASTTNARIKVLATDEAGNQSSLVSVPIQIVTSVSKLTGDFIQSRGTRYGSADQTLYYGPYSITSDGTYLYVADSCHIRRIKIADAVSDKLAGTPFRCESTDGINGKTRTPLQMTALGDFIYFTDFTSHTLRRVNKNQSSPDYGKFETVAGTSGVAGGTDGVGTAATFSSPTGVVAVGTGVYVTDSIGRILRHVDTTTMTVSTVAGAYASSAQTNGVGTAARFLSPLELAFDNGASSGSSGSLYIIDGSGTLVRRFDIATANVTTLAGSTAIFGNVNATGTSASFRSLRGIAADGTNLYVSDFRTQVIRKIDLATAAVTTLSGSPGVAGFAEGVSPRYGTIRSIVSQGSYIYVADMNNNVVMRVSTADGSATRFSGFPYGSTAEHSAIHSNEVGDGALFDISNGLTTIDGDTIFAASYYGGTIRKLVISTNTVTTIAGAAYQIGNTDATPGTDARFKNIVGIVQYGTKLYVVDRLNNSVKMIDLAASNAVTTIAGSTAGTSGSNDNTTGTSAKFSNPWAITTDGTYLYVSDTNNYRIRRVSMTAPYAVETIAGSTTGFVDHPTTGTSAKFGTVKGLAVASGILYAADTTNFAIRKITLSGSFPVETIAGANPGTGATSGYTDHATATSARFTGVVGVAIADTKLYIADGSPNNAIRTYDLNTGEVATYAGGPNIPASRGLGTSARSTYLPTMLALASYGTSKLYATTSASNYGGITQFNLADNQTLSLAGGANFRIWGATSNSIEGERDGSIVAVPTTHRSLGCVVGDGSKLYAFDYSGAIYSYNYDMSGELLLAGQRGSLGYVDANGTAARLSRVNSGNCAYNSGSIYFTQSAHHVVRKFDVATKDITTIAGSADSDVSSSDGSGTAARFKKPESLTVLDSNIYVLENDGTALRKISIANAQVTTVAGVSGSAAIVDGSSTVARMSGTNSIAGLNSKVYLLSGSPAVLRSFDTATGIVSTIAGSSTEAGAADGMGTSARLSNPAGLSSDGTNLWFSDYGTFKIRKFRVANNQVISIFGNEEQNQANHYSAVETNRNFGQVSFISGLGFIMSSAWQSSLIK